MAEILKIREITIDTMQHKEFNVKEEELKLIRFYQNDLNSAKLLINVTHDKVITDFSTATSVQIAFLKPDCKRVFQDVQNVNQMQGKYYVVLSTQTLIAYGNVIAQLRFTFPNNKVIETCKFAFTVDESIMSDDAMKSTNEFPVIQKAIEAGDKLEGVDIDGIIAAGAKADAALPKTGGTMTGNLILDGSTGERSLSFKVGTGASDLIAMRNVLATNTFSLRDYRLGMDIWSWKDNTFTLHAQNTNLLKTTGGTMSGDFKMTRPNATTARSIRWDTNGVEDVVLGLGGSSKWVAWDQKNSKGIYEYDPSTNTFNVTASNTNLVKKAEVFTDIAQPNGDAKIVVTSSQDMLAEVVNAGRGIRTIYSPGSALNTPSSKGFRGIANLQGTPYGYIIGVDTDNKVWSNFINGSTWSGWKCVTGNDKDGRATLTLTADAENPDTAVPLIATRRGNTVNLRGSVRIKSGATGTVVSTLPVDMRPVDMQVSYETSFSDNTSVKVVVFPNGNISVYTQNKSIYLSLTYVVD